MNECGEPVLYAIVTGSPPRGTSASWITCNSLAKWAAGISDTLPLGLLVEAVGKRQPVVVMPFSNWGSAQFPGDPASHEHAHRVGRDDPCRRRHLQTTRPRHRG
ncbi:MAG: hypothetical protein M3460_18805 [Actinomycetota bacterium]|nr:hypothetical protein [Actinomycetota bacterium]